MTNFFKATKFYHKNNNFQKLIMNYKKNEEEEETVLTTMLNHVVHESCQTEAINNNSNNGNSRSKKFASIKIREKVVFDRKKGDKSLVRKTGPAEKCIWGIFLMSVILTALVLVCKAIKDFSSHTVTTNMDSLSTSFDRIHFPAITVCNMNKMKLSVLEKYGIGEDARLLDIFDRYHNVGTQSEFTEEEVKIYENVKNKIQSPERLKVEGQHKCHNMFVEYYWKNRFLDFNDFEGGNSMHYAQITDENLCCQIFPGMLAEENSVYNASDFSFWTSNSNPWQIMFDGHKPGIKTGKQGVSVLIDVETYEYFSSHSSGSQGVYVLIQHYRDVPLMRQEAFILSPGFEVDVGLSVTEITTTQNAIDRFNPQERDCFTAQEVNLVSLPLRKGYRMSMKNCLYDKALHAVKKLCDCQPPFYALGELGNLSTCVGTDLYCALKVFDDVTSPEYSNIGTESKCRSPCDDVIYDSRITMASYPNKRLFRNRKEVCRIVKKLIKICTGWLDPYALEELGQNPDELKIKKDTLLTSSSRICDTLKSLNVNDSCNVIEEYVKNHEDAFKEVYNYAKQNLLWLNVYVKDSFVTKIVRDERMTRTNFVANVGGLLGLCMGFSLVNVAEIIYFFIKKQYSKFSKYLSKQRR